MTERLTFTPAGLSSHHMLKVCLLVTLSVACTVGLKPKVLPLFVPTVLLYCLAICSSICVWRSSAVPWGREAAALVPVVCLCILRLLYVCQRRRHNTLTLTLLTALTLLTSLPELALARIQLAESHMDAWEAWEREIYTLLYHRNVLLCLWLQVCVCKSKTLCAPLNPVSDVLLV